MGRRTFRFRKEASDLDVDLPDGCRDDEYLQALEPRWTSWSDGLQPQLVIYLAGADPHEGDRLGRLKLTWDGLEARDRRVFRLGLAAPRAAGLCHGRWLRPPHGGHRAVQVNTYRVAHGLLAALAESHAMSDPKPAKPQPEPRSATACSAHQHPLDGQRCLRPCQQCRLLQLVRHRGQRPPDRAGVLDIHQGETIGLVIETQCNYFASLAFPQTSKPACAWRTWARPACATKWACLRRASPDRRRGHFVHVYVDSKPAGRCRCRNRSEIRSGATHVTACPSQYRRQPTRPASMPPSKAVFPRAPSCPRRCPRELIGDILRVATRAPSGTNTQPWKVYVLQGASRDGLVAKVCAAHDAMYADPSAGRAVPRGI
jgi:hypothetical protein